MEALELSVFLFGAIGGVRALSLLSAGLLLFKYLELAPKSTTFYLTGTTLSRAGRDIKFVCTIFIVYVVGAAIVAQQWFGTTMEEFSTLIDALFTLTTMIAGYGGVYRRLVASYPVIGPIYFFVFNIVVLVFVTPFFLAIINDAYAVRNSQLQAIFERRRLKREAELQAQQAAAGGKRQQFDKKKFAVKPSS